MAKRYTRDDGVEIIISDTGVRTERHPSGHTVEYNPMTGVTTDRSASGRVERKGEVRTRDYGATHAPSQGSSGHHGGGITASESRRRHEERHDYYSGEFSVEISDLEENNRAKLLKGHKHRTIKGKTYYCFVNSVTKEEEWFYCPKPKKVTIKHFEGKAQIEYIGLTHMSQPDNREYLLDQWANVDNSPVVISEKGYSETDVVCLYRADITQTKNGVLSPVIDYSEPYLAHAGQDYAVPFSASKSLYNTEKRYFYNNHGFQISDDGKHIRDGVETSITLKPEKIRFNEYDLKDLKNTENSNDLSNYTMRDLVVEQQEEEKARKRKEEIDENHQKTKIEKDEKIDYLRNNFERKQMQGQPEFFLIENPETKEKKWYYCPQATLFVDKNPRTKKVEKYVSLGVVSSDPRVDDGKVKMSVEAYKSTDIVILYEVDIQKDKKPVIKRNKFYIVHLDTLEMVEQSNYGSSISISEDGETMEVLNPFAQDMRYDTVSTRPNGSLGVGVD